LRRRRAQLEPPRDLDYSADPRALTSGNTIEPLVDGDETYPAMLDAISAAQSYVHFETYVFVDDTIGKTFARVLIKKAREGVRVRFIYDAVGGLTLSAGFIGDLRDAEIEVLEYRPLLPWRRKHIRRDHRKILVVDGRMGFTGGLNIGEDYAPSSVGGRDWRDTHCCIVGPVVAQLDQMFANTWHHGGGKPYEVDEVAASDVEAAPGAGEERALAIGSDHWGRRMAIRRHYLHAIRAAREYIYIANAYFIPDPGIRRALVKAARRGVEVHVVTSADSDLKTVQYASEATYRGFLRRGVHIHLWPRTTMHAKTAVIDGVWAVVGSYNLDYMSLFRNLEVVVTVVGRSFGAKMTAMYRDDLERCTELTLASWAQRPWWRKAAAWFFYKLRRWF
jgi:cardiolipin synthase